MSGKASGEVWEFDLPTNEKLVCLALADHADHNGENVYPSQALIAWKTGFSVRHVRRLIDSLIKKGAVICMADGKGKGRPNTYAIDFEHAPRLPPFREQGRTSESPTQVGHNYVLPSKNGKQGGSDIQESDLGRTSESPTGSDIQESDRTSINGKDGDDDLDDQSHHQLFDAGGRARDLALLRERFEGMGIAESIWSRWTQPVEHQLACILHAQAEGANPPGLLRTMLDGDGVPLPKYVERARRLLNPEPAPEPPVPALVTPPAPAIGLDEKPGGTLTIREIWQATLGQLQMQLNRDTYAHLRDAKAVRFEDGILTVQPRPHAVRTFARLQGVIDQVASGIAGAPIAVRAVNEAEPAPAQ